MILMGIFLIVAGMLMLFKAPLFWRLTEQWTSRDGTEPSALYLWSTRFGGLACSLVGAANLFAEFAL